MGPTLEEKAIKQIFDAIHIVDKDVKTPPMYLVEFDVSAKTNGSVTTYDGNEDNKAFRICSNYPGEMSIFNSKFVRTVVHEVVHYNGIHNHESEFWQKLDALYAKVIKYLEDKLNDSKTKIS